MSRFHSSGVCRVLLAAVILVAAAQARADQVLWSQHAGHDRYFGGDSFGIRPVSWLDASAALVGTRFEVNAQAGHRTRVRMFDTSFELFEGTVTGKATYDFSNNSVAGSLRSHLDLGNGLYTYDPFNLSLRRDLGTGRSWSHSEEIWSHSDTVVIWIVPVTYSVGVSAGVEAYARNVLLVTNPIGVTGTVGIRPYLQGSAVAGVGAGAWGFSAAAGVRATLRADLTAESPFSATLAGGDLPLDLTMGARFWLELGLFVTWPDIDLGLFTIDGGTESWSTTIVDWRTSYGPIRVARIVW